MRFLDQPEQPSRQEQHDRPHDDHADHHGEKIAERLFLRRAHQHRQAEIEQIEAVEPERRQDGEHGNSMNTLASHAAVGA